MRAFAYEPGEFWDEMFASHGRVRDHYTSLVRELSTLSQAEVDRRQRAADLSFQVRGITFAVNQAAEGVEKIMPFDLVPRIITSREWHTIERGLEQRVRALNLFLQDIYHDGCILRSGVVPPEAVLGSRGYVREVHGMDVPLGVYTHVVGSDLVRDSSGEFYVLEDNLRTPSGVSYVVENRRVLKRVWSQIFHDYDVRPVEGYAQDLLEVLRSVAPDDADGEPTVVLLTPGVYNSAYFEHAFLAKGMGVQMVEGSDLFVDDGFVYMRTTTGPQRVHVIYRRVDDDFLDPLAFRGDSALGVPGLLASYRMGRVNIANGIGAGVADDKAIYAYVPKIIRYYLDEEPILPTVRTFLPTEPDDMKYVLEHLDELVVKSVNESGGYGMLVGPHSSIAEREQFRRYTRADSPGCAQRERRLGDGLSPSQLIPALPLVTELADRFRDLEPFEAVCRMSEMVHQQFEYQPGVTDVTTSVAEVVAGGRGVCQDFAHLLIGLCRALRIPARYVSGYIVAGEAGGPSRGGGASHAWVEAYTPSRGWRGFDPTNDLLANDRYIKLAVGRDYHDVPPTRGTYRGAAVGNLDVAVSTRVLE